MSLVQDLRASSIRAMAVRPEGDKTMRMAAQAAKIESGAVYLPRNATWIKDPRTEILAFPHGRHDDQVDSISQFLRYVTSRPKCHRIAASRRPVAFTNADPGDNKRRTIRQRP